MVDNSSRRTFQADQDGIKLAAILNRYHKGSRAGSARLHGLSIIAASATTLMK
jgi:hypothetical protein